MSTFNPALVQMLRQTLHSLKRQYGSRATIVKVGSQQVDYKTGIKTRTTDPHVIPKVIMLPEVLVREEKRGSVYEVWKTTFLIDLKDLPSGLELEVDDQILMNSKTYQVVTSETYGNACVVLQANRLRGS